MTARLTTTHQPVDFSHGQLFQRKIGWIRVGLVNTASTILNAACLLLPMTSTISKGLTIILKTYNNVGVLCIECFFEKLLNWFAVIVYRRWGEQRMLRTHWVVMRNMRAPVTEQWNSVCVFVINSSWLNIRFSLFFTQFNASKWFNSTLFIFLWLV